MATKIEYHKWMQLLPSVAVFDLEFVGDINDPESCGLWEIGATSLTTDDSFAIIVDPCIDFIPEPQEGCFDLTQIFLEENAVSLKQGLYMFVSWASKYRLFVSHNCFKSDISVLKGAFRKCDLQFPSFLFVDSLMILRQHVKLKNYKLNCVYQHYTNCEMLDSHRALPDAKALKNVLLSMGPVRYTIYAYPITLTPLQNIRGVGHACESALIERGIHSVEDLENQIITTGSSMVLWHNVSNDNIINFVLNQLNLPVQDLQNIHDDILWRINKKCNITNHGD
jgi:hypothetical protein